MKNGIILSVLIISFILLVSACKKEDTKAVNQPSQTKSEETQPAKSTVSDMKTEVNVDENCSKTYDFMKSFTEQMEQRLAKMGKKAPQKKELPSKEKFVAACKELPIEIIRCLDMEYAMKNQQECSDAKKNADPEKIKKFEEALK